MAIIKSYTDINQSKKLAKILPLESADMHYFDYGNCAKVYIGFDVNETKPEINKGVYEYIPSWSLGALFDVLPEGIIESYYIPNLQKENGKYSIAYGNDELLCIADNSVDACYKMIIKLNELNLL